MDKQYWDELADTFDQDVIEIYNAERRNVLLNEVDRLSKKARTAADLGCGTGGLTRKLAPLFKHVIALDLSDALIKVAKERVTAKNVDFGVFDLAGEAGPTVRADVTLCINVLISPEFEIRRRIARNLYRATRKNGYAVVAVPAYESMLHVYHTLLRCRMKEGDTYSRATKKVSTLFGREVPEPLSGNILLQEVATKHYTREELTGFLVDAGFHVKRIKRLELPWAEELDEIPSWLREPYPWDWLAVVQR